MRCKLSREVYELEDWALYLHLAQDKTDIKEIFFPFPLFHFSGDGRPLLRLPLERKPMTLHLLKMKKLPRDISTLVFNKRMALIFFYQVQQEPFTDFF